MKQLRFIFVKIKFFNQYNKLSIINTTQKNLSQSVKYANKTVHIVLQYLIIIHRNPHNSDAAVTIVDTVHVYESSLLTQCLCTVLKFEKKLQ